jgi:bacterioferritin
MDKKMIELLNRALKDEYKAVAQYLHHYNNVRTLHTDIVDHFKEHMDDEIGHANILCARIYALGGKPAIEVANWAEFTDDVDKALEDDAVAERDAIELYKEVLAHAEETDDIATIMMIEGIIDDERHHLDDFTKFLRASL